MPKHTNVKLVRLVKSSLFCFYPIQPFTSSSPASSPKNSSSLPSTSQVHPLLVDKYPLSDLENKADCSPTPSARKLSIGSKPCLDSCFPSITDAWYEHGVILHSSGCEVAGLGLVEGTCGSPTGCLLMSGLRLKEGWAHSRLWVWLLLNQPSSCDNIQDGGQSYLLRLFGHIMLIRIHLDCQFQEEYKYKVKGLWKLQADHMNN
jgi:hypothetical protein